MIRIAAILYDINKSNYFENQFEFINKNRFKLYFIFIGEQKGETFFNLQKRGAEVFFIPLRGKINLPLAFIKLIFILARNYPNVIHCHLLWANILGLIAGKILFIKKRIYTRHHSSYHHKYAKNGILIDRLSNFFSTDIIAISKNVKEILEYQENIDPKKISIIYHGFDFSKFKIDKKIRNEYREQLGINNDKLVIGAISRYINWKRVDLIIDAFKIVLSETEKIHLLLSNGNGPEAHLINERLKSLPANSYTEIKFENDQNKLYNSFDVFIHIPEDDKIEAFGQVYIEAIAYSKPMVITLSGIANELDYTKSKFCKIVQHNSLDDITRALNNIILNINEKVEHNMNLSEFSIENHMKKIEVLYAK